MSAPDELRREIAALRERISALSAASLRISASLDLETVLREVVESAQSLTGGGKAAVERPEFRWVNTILGNIKNALCGTYHAVRPKYAQRYLAEFEYRFNRRFDLPDIIPRLVYVALRTPPMPERLLKLRLA